MRIFIVSFLLCLISTVWLDAQPAGNLRREAQAYFPAPDSLGGWRTLAEPEDIRRIAGMEKEKLDEAFNFIRTTTTNGGLLVARNGYLVYEEYFGKGQREATPNPGSVGKSYTSIAIGILIGQRPDLFRDGLNQKIFTPTYLPQKAFPLPDPRMAEITLGQLLTFSAGIRGNNPVYINGEASTIDPAGPDGWYAMVDEYALGLEEGKINSMPFSTKTLWCEPGGGYSYASASIHIASIIIRHITGMELEEYLDKHVAEPLGWGRWGYGYKYASRVNHTPGAGGIALRSTDMLRFGYMLLREGRWGQRQVVPREFIKHASGKSPFNPHFPYSLQFNVNSGGEIPSLPRDAYWKTGSGGHCIYVVPSLDLVVWKLGGRDGQYGVRDTGMPEPEPLPNPVPAIDDGTANPTREEYAKTLEMVIAAVVEGDKPATNKKFNFEVHEIDSFQNRMGATSLLDMDNDGDLDYVFGRFGDMYWYEYTSPSKWLLHEIGKGAKTDVGGIPLDVNRDGLMDFVVGDSWYENKTTGKNIKFILHQKHMQSKSHDIIAADIDGDGIKDIVSVSNAQANPDLVWYKIPRNYKKEWKPFRIGDGIHGGIGPHGYGDLDNDGRIDIVRGNSWFRNVDGKGTKWEEHMTLTPPGGSRPGPFGLALKSWVYDINKDGMPDIVQAEADTQNGRVFWWENVGGGKRFVFHLISAENTNQDTHSLALADFDGDGSIDIVSGGGPLSTEKHKLFLWENVNGDGSEWNEHIILEGYRSHETVAADVNGDGLVDIVSKPWRGGLHYFLENKGIERD